MQCCVDCLIRDACELNYPEIPDRPPCASELEESAPSASTNNAMDAIASLHREFLREKSSGAVSIGLDSMIEWCEKQQHQ